MEILFDKSFISLKRRMLLFEIFFLKSFKLYICLVDKTGVPKAKDSKTTLGKPSHLEGNMK